MILLQKIVKLFEGLRGPNDEVFAYWEWVRTLEGMVRYRITRPFALQLLPGARAEARRATEDAARRIN